MRDSRNAGRRFIAYLWGTIFILLLVLPMGRTENKWRIRINIPEYKLYLYHGPELRQSYQVAVGKADSPSPTGKFTIINKVRNPTWYPPERWKPPVPPGPNNPLGNFWLGLNIPGYGIHGNSASWSIGSPVSLGCFRMHNRDIEQLFRIIPIGTPVEAVYQTILGGIEVNDQAWIEVFPDIYQREKPAEVLPEVFGELHWIYRPHLKALLSLLPLSLRPGKIQAPRAIHIEGNITGIDGFYWNGTVYVSKNVLAALPLTGIPEAGNTIFNEYLELQRLHNLAGIQINWNETSNTLYLSRVLLEYLP